MNTEATVRDGDGADRMTDRAYAELKSMLMDYAIKPGERINEGELSRRIGVSRTPLREALNQLRAESLLRFAPGRGYFCRDLDVHETFNLYELRKALETSAIALAIQRAQDSAIDELEMFLHHTGPEAGDLPPEKQVEFDEAFHMSLMSLSGNSEMLRVLANINDRIRFVRLIDIGKTDRRQTQREHLEAVRALRARDASSCITLLEHHIGRRLEQLTADLKQGFVQIYMPHTQPLPQPK